MDALLAIGCAPCDRKTDRRGRARRGGILRVELNRPPGDPRGTRLGLIELRKKRPTVTQLAVLRLRAVSSTPLT